MRYDSNTFFSKNQNPIPMRIIITLLVSIFLLTNTLKAQTRQADSLALVGLYNATNGANWINTWDFSQPLSTWRNVRMYNGRVVWLNLGNNNLTGTLPNLNLTALKTLYLYNNQITGTIPDFSNLPVLQYLYLYRNQLTGTVPNFNHLPLLRHLGLNENQLTGTVPDFNALPQLEYLYLNDNQLTGTIPDFRAIGKLTRLYLHKNSLGGVIPDFSNLPVLEYLYLGENDLVGAIPNFSGLLQLTRLRLQQNQLTDTIPPLNNLRNLRQLHLQSNQLTGRLPRLASNRQLNQLYLDENQLTGSIPDWSLLDQMRSIQLTHNQLTGAITIFNELLRLERIDLSHNLFADSIPDFNLNLFMRSVSLTDNQFTFEDILPNYDSIQTNMVYNYLPQDSIGTTRVVNTVIGASYTIDVEIDDSVSSNIYYWYRDTILIDSTFGVNRYRISNFQQTDIGIYTAKVVNPKVNNPELVLQSRPTFLGVNTAVQKIPIKTISIYPNPTTAQVNIDVSAIEGYFLIRVLDQYGRILKSMQGNGGGVHAISLKDSAAGMYIIQLKQGQSIWQNKIIKK